MYEPVKLYTPVQPDEKEPQYLHLVFEWEIPSRYFPKPFFSLKKKHPTDRLVTVALSSRNFADVVSRYIIRETGGGGETLSGDPWPVRELLPPPPAQQ